MLSGFFSFFKNKFFSIIFLSLSATRKPPSLVVWGKTITNSSPPYRIVTSTFLKLSCNKRAVSIKHFTAGKVSKPLVYFFQVINIQKNE